MATGKAPMPPGATIIARVARESTLKAAPSPKPVVAESELGVGVDSEASAIAVVPRRRGMNLQFGREFYLGGPSQVLF